MPKRKIRLLKTDEQLRTELSYMYRQKEYTQPTEDQCGYILTKPCKLWQGSTHPRGHGRVHLGYNVYEFVHRVAYRLAGNDLLDTDMVCHKCGVHSCYEEEHLYKGTSSSNTLDSVKHGTFVGNRRKTYE